MEIFDLDRTTCLRTDWSKQGVGYFLFQKHCDCDAVAPTCCEDGWRITLAGSRFLSTAEQNYAAVEGEGLAIAWSLEQSKYFTMGCNDLTIATDHEPLTKIFADKTTLDEITNTRLLRLKRRILPWYFRIVHLPGKTNLAANATSRKPSGNAHDQIEEDRIEAFISAAIRRDTESVVSLTWDRLATETAKDSGMTTLIDAILRGFPQESRTDDTVASFWRYRYGLYVIDGVVIFDDRAVIPPSLRQPTLYALHSAHQGVSMMGARARAILFWPGMTDDIERVRQTCQDCIKNAPSHAPLPAIISNPPSTPFEMIHADFFDCAGQHYMIVGDRLSGWSDVFQSPYGSPQSGSEGLITCLRNYFSRFGVPTEISSDGGPEFVSKATETFLKRWGVSHRISSAYNAQSNGRAEVAVKSAKRLLRSNTGPSGSLDTDQFLRAMMQLRNTPDRDCDLSPAQIVFGKPIRDAFAFASRLEKFTNGNIRPLWRDAWAKKEEALRERFHHSAEKRNEHVRELPTLHPGDRCYIQNQSGNHPKRWDRSGTVVEAHGNDSYSLKVDGTGRVTRRNRRYLRQFRPASPDITSKNFISHQPTTQPVPTVAKPEVPVAQSQTIVPSNTSTALPAPDASNETNHCEKAPRTDPQQPAGPIDSPPSLVAPPSINATPFPLTIQPTKPDVPPRPRRSTRPPPRYEPETGHWI